jgi:dCTP diphosphatase
VARDDDTTLGALKTQVSAFNRARDWGRYHSPRNLAMALSVEASELLELYLWCEDAGPQPAVPSREPRVAHEMADVLICLLSLADRTGVDLAAAVEAKLARNAEKYPAEQVSGRMEKYDEYSQD